MVRNNSVCTTMNNSDDEDPPQEDEGGRELAVNPILARNGGAVMVRETKTRRRRVVMC